MKCTIKKRGFVAAMIILGSMIPLSGYAHDRVDFLPAWSAVASTCAVDDNNINNYATSLSDLSIKSTVTTATTIVARCDVYSHNGLNPTYNTLWVGYRDPDGAAANYRVQARVIRVRRSDGINFLIGAQFDSNAWLNIVNIRTQGHAPIFTHAWDFLNNDYYVEITLTRSSLVTSGTPLAFHVRLSRSDKIPQ